MALKFILVSSLALFVLAGCSGPADVPATPSTEEDKAKIDQLRDSFIAAFNSGDAAAIADLYASDGVAMPQNAPAMTGHEAIMNHNKGTFDQFAPKIAIKSEELKFMGEYAFDRGTYTMNLTPKDPKGSPINDEGKYLVILQRQGDGNWKVIRDIDNSSKPLAPPPPPAKK